MAMRLKPMAPRMTPSTSPEPISLDITRHHWARRISPRARARMTSVAAWDPELPPLEMMSGTKRARTTARSICRSKKPMAVAVSISPRNRMMSEGLNATEPLERAGVLRLGHVEGVVQRHDANQHALGVSDRQGGSALCLKQPHRRLLGVGGLQGHDALVDEVRQVTREGR